MLLLVMEHPVERNESYKSLNEKPTKAELILRELFVPPVQSVEEEVNQNVKTLLRNPTLHVTEKVKPEPNKYLAFFKIPIKLIKRAQAHLLKIVSVKSYLA